jgi:hypothetical protein
VVFANRNHRACLQAVDALAVVRDEAYLVANGKPIEAAIRDAVAVEIDLGPIGGLDKAAIPSGQEACNPAVVGHQMPLYVAAPFANIIFEQPSGRVERVTNGDMGILMRVTSRRISIDDDFASRDDKLDAHLEQVALPPARVPTFDDDPARDDPIEEALEFLGTTADAGHERIRTFHMAESDLEWQLHQTLRRQICPL